MGSEPITRSKRDMATTSCVSSFPMMVLRAPTRNCDRSSVPTCIANQEITLPSPVSRTAPKPAPESRLKLASVPRSPCQDTILQEFQRFNQALTQLCNKRLGICMTSNFLKSYPAESSKYKGVAKGWSTTECQRTLLWKEARLQQSTWLCHVPFFQCCRSSRHHLWFLEDWTEHHTHCCDWAREVITLRSLCQTSIQTNPTWGKKPSGCWLQAAASSAKQNHPNNKKVAFANNGRPPTAKSGHNEWRHWLLRENRRAMLPAEPKLLRLW